MPLSLPLTLLPACIFFANATLYVTLYSRLPEVSSAQGGSPSALGLALLSQTAGTLLGFPTASPLIDRFGARRVAGATLLAAMILLPAAATGIIGPGLWGIAIPLGLYGFAMAVMEVAKNLIAARIEERSGKNVISKSHGFWSAGLFVGALMGGWAAGAGISTGEELLWIGCAFLPLVGLLLVRAGDPEPMGPASDSEPRFAKPDAFVIGLLILIAGFSITEGVVYDWSMFYLRQDLALDANTAAKIYAAFTIGMFVARMLGDDLRNRLPTPRLIRFMAVCVVLGVAITVFGPHFATGLLYVGFSLIGSGVALAAPVATALAMRHPTRSATRTMASYSLISLLALFAVPPLMGTIVETHGAVWAIVFASPLLGFVAIFAPRIVARMRNLPSEPHS
ncbi:MFS transporter [Celeribacter neptunius]|uniref:Fucose permease n=1 Tax=Celeribacter neptunius TaxID=588602 RepID=A0A1I3JX52_9RHOB|nr:MFS transporter [Celeribacter neptunius]SFI64849.1 Fucose permease [Celeribacter neptunius]